MKDVDGNKSDKYFDVDFSKAKSERLLNRIDNHKSRLFKKIEKKQRPASDTNVYEIDVDFTEDVTAGKFCYELYVYSVYGVSQVTEVCKTVKAWGGKSELVGSWEFIRFSDRWKEELFLCNENKYVASYDSIISDERLYVFKNDGSFTKNIELSYYEIDQDSTFSTCKLMFLETLVNDKWVVRGQWFYDENNALIMVYAEQVLNNNIVETNYDILDPHIVTIENGNLTLNDEGFYTYFKAN